jgi:hypothetical protein
MDRINSFYDYDYLTSSVLPDSDLAKAAMPSMDFLQNNLFRPECESQKALKQFNQSRSDRIQLIEACAQESGKLVVQNCLGEFVRKCVKRRQQCETGMLEILREINYDHLRASVVKDSQQQMKELGESEEKKLKFLDVFHQNESSMPERESKSKDHEQFVHEWNRYHTMGRDLNGFFRIVNNDYGFSYLEGIVAKSLGQNELSFMQKLTVEKVDKSFIDTSDSESSSTTVSVQQGSFFDEDVDVEGLSNDCISITEENRLLLLEGNKKDGHCLRTNAKRVLRSDVKKT